MAALIQTSREDLKLRPENLLALELAGIEADSLLCTDDIPDHEAFPSDTFALVDHNRILPHFSENNPDTRIIAIVDHHEDEKQHPDANPRIVVVPVGSAASLVTEHLRECGLEIPSDICTLLLCAILIDTGGLHPNGKAEAIDHSAASYLLPRSGALTLSGVSTASLNEMPLYISPPVTSLTQQLAQCKADISHLGTSEQLRRDYKQYRWKVAPEGRMVDVGLSTVPLDLRVWLSRGVLQEEFWMPLDDFMDKRGLDVLGVLTTFSDAKKTKNKGAEGSESARGGSTSSKEKKGKHKRQMLFVTRDEKLAQRLWHGIQESDELEAEERLIYKYATKFRTNMEKSDIAKDGGVAGRIVRAYKQGNARATRKVIAPLLQQIFEGRMTD